VAPGGLTRDQFIEIVDKIVRCDLPDEDEQDKLLWLFETTSCIRAHLPSSTSSSTN